MNFFQLLFLGYKNYIKGTIFLFKHKLQWFFIFPIILFACIYWLGTFFKSLESEVSLDLERTSNQILTINELIWTTLKMMFFDAMYIVFTQFTLYIVVVLLSPILAMLSEKIEEKITGKKYDYSFKMLVNDIKRGAIIAFRNLIWFYLFVGLFLGVVSFFSLSAKSFIVFAIPFVVGFYYYGFSFIDYVNERRRLNIQQSIYFVSKHKGLAISIGSVYSVFFLMYFYVYKNFNEIAGSGTQIGWSVVLVFLLIIAALTPVLAITSATLSMNELLKKENSLKINKNNPQL
jgi:CysZ protein